MNSPYTTRTTINRDALAAYTSAVLFARHAYRADTAEPVAHVGPRLCPCGVALSKHRKFCDPCRDEARRLTWREYDQRRRTRKAAR